MSAPAAGRPHPHITDDERRLLAMTAAGLNREQIGARTGVVPGTVGRYLTRIYRKLGAVNAANAVAIAIRDGLINANQKKEAHQQ